MKISTIILAFLLLTFGGNAQPFKAGVYDELRLAYNEELNMLRGYFESYTGLDEQTGNPRFSCIFYIEGRVTGKKFKVVTYYPNKKAEGVIEGTVVLQANKKLTIKLSEEQDGCWNVLHFKDAPAQFSLAKEKNWIDVSYVVRDKTFFYKEKSESTRMNAYLIKSDFVCIDRREGGWVHCTYFGKNAVTTGWVMDRDLH